MKNQNFEIISIAEDTGGVKAAAPWIEAGKVEYTVLVDKQHVVTRLYNMVNVPTAVWINEQGRIVRPNEVAYSNNKGMSVTKVDTEPWINGLRDWVKNGEKSAFAMSEAELRERVKPQNPDWALASAEFGLAEYLYQAGQGEAAIPHYKEAQRLNPESWNFKRQAWALSSSKDKYGTTFTDEVKKLNGKPYYEPHRLPPVKK